ncbi:MAG: hypothetical protein HY826_15500 [Actinobacteria bacterium]|nr:hypothetical protein [Actinomycetota bacterium]
MTAAAADVVNIWSLQHSYVPPSGALANPDTSPWFQYVEVVEGIASVEHCFKVIAYNAAGRGHSSAATCGSPPS